jgi:hypothetical protein
MKALNFQLSGFGDLSSVLLSYEFILVPLISQPKNDLFVSKFLKKR